MELIILRSNLLEGLQFIEKGVGGSDKLPVLENIKLQAKENNKVVLTSTDLEIAIEATVSGKVKEKGTVIIPFDVFNNIVSNLNSEKINLVKKDNKINLNSDNYEANIVCENPEEYPVIPTIENRTKSIEINSEVLENHLNRASVATKHSDIRPEINGVYLDYKGENISFVGTDSFRLVESVLRKQEFQSNLDEMKVIVPLDTVDTILKNLSGVEGEVEIFVDPNQIKFESKNLSVISRLVEGDYPDYKAVIPKSTEQDLSIKRKELQNAVKTTKTFSGKAQDISLKIGDNKKVLQVTSFDSSVGENNYRVPVDIKGEQNEFAVNFNWRYILDGVNILESDSIELGFNDPDKPVVMKDKDIPSLTYVVMPIRS
ncbi:MAG: DNA polymerase III subunit beta [Candidatus Magasanikbacteria bacterium]